SVQLEFTDGALSVLAAEAMKRETGVRSLRSMLEEVLLDLRYNIGSRKGEQVVITEEYVIEALQRGPRSLLANSILPSSGKVKPAKNKDDENAPAKPEKGPMRQKRDSA
ncbi:MAG: hypothetical protein ACI9S9_003432, partial [Planctomycetota bacterium]